MKDSLTPNEIAEVVQKITFALDYADRVRNSQTADVSYETMQRSGFNRPTGWRRKYSLADARRDAETVAINLRAAWEILDPSNIG